MRLPSWRSSSSSSLGVLRVTTSYDTGNDKSYYAAASGGAAAAPSTPHGWMALYSGYKDTDPIKPHSTGWRGGGGGGDSMTANEAISSLDCRWLVGWSVEVPLLVVGRNPLRIKCSRHNPGSVEYYYYYYLSAGIAFICQDDPRRIQILISFLLISQSQEEEEEEATKGKGNPGKLNG